MFTPKFAPRSMAILVIASSFTLFMLEAKAIQFSFSSLPTASINFAGGVPNPSLATITFSNDILGHTFEINNPLAFQGTFSGTWIMGPVASLGPFIETAPVSGVGTLAIFDNANVALTADLIWGQAVSDSQSTPITETLGVPGNVTSIAYSGTDLDLQAFALGLNQTATLSFAFPGAGKSLTQLVAGGGTGPFRLVPEITLTLSTADDGVSSTSFSGTFVATKAPDSGPTLALLALGLGGLAAMRGRPLRTETSN